MLQPQATHLEEARFTIIKNTLLQLLEQQAITQLQPLTQVPGSYGELLQLALLTEWAEEQEKLKRCFRSTNDETELKCNFKALCAERDRVNQGSVLHYWASPESLCNQLYWHIAKQLFAPLSLGEMISLLIPSSPNALIIEFVINAKNSSHEKEKMIDRCQLILKIKPIREAFPDHSPESPKAFTRCVSGGGMVLNLEEIEKLPFHLHQQLYDALDAYPKLKNNLYAHNTALQQVLFDIEWHNQKGMSVNAALTRFIEKLTLSGTRYTATEYAGHRALWACVEFRTYLDQLPEEFKQTLLKLTANGFSLEGVLTYLVSLLNIRCVETAASRLKAIQTTHFHFLDKPLSATETQAREIEQRYRSPSLDLIGYQTSQTLPIKLCKQLLKQVNLRSTMDYIDCILNLPPETYESFLESVQILANPALPNKLADQLAIFSEEQNKAFIKAVIKNVDKFGGRKNILDFIIQIGNNNCKILLVLLALLPNQDRLTVVNQKNLKGFTLLHHWLKQTDFKHIQALLILLPEQDRLLAINEKDTTGFTLLHRLLEQNNFECLQSVLMLLPEQDRLAAINEKDPKGRPLLHLAIATGKPEHVISILECCPKHDRLSALNQSDASDPNGNKVLHYVIRKGHTDICLSLLALCPENDQVTAINQKNRGGDTVLYHAASYNRLFWSLLSIYSENERLAALIEKNQGSNIIFHPFVQGGGDTILRLFARTSQQSTLYKLLALFPEQDRLMVITQTSLYQTSVLSFMANYQKSSFLETISDLLPKYSRLTDVKPDILSLTNILTLGLFTHLYVANQILTITLEAQEHRGYFKKTQELRKKTLAEALNLIQNQIHRYIIVNAESPDLDRRCQPAAFLSWQLREINLLIDQKIIRSPVLRQQKFLVQAIFILLNLIILPVLLIRIFLHFWDKKKHPEFFWMPRSTPVVQQAQACQSRITELQQLVDQYKYQSKPSRLFYM